MTSNVFCGSTSFVRCDMLLTWKRIQSLGISRMIHLTKRQFIFNGGGGGGGGIQWAAPVIRLPLTELFFPYETFYLAWFYAFLYFRGIELLFVHNRVEGLRACFRGKIWTFWMSETLVFGILVDCLDYYKCCHCKILRIVLVTPPLNPLCFFTPPSPPLKPHFFHDPPPPPPSKHHVNVPK